MLGVVAGPAADKIVRPVDFDADREVRLRMGA